MKVYYGKAVYNQKEIKAVTNVLKKIFFFETSIVLMQTQFIFLSDEE